MRELGELRPGATQAGETEERQTEEHECRSALGNAADDEKRAGCIAEKTRSLTSLVRKNYSPAFQVPARDLRVTAWTC
jgi:hypothetical protein